MVLGFIGTASAEISEAEYFDEVPIVLFASRLSQSLADAPAAVTIIDRDMIRASGFTDIADLFRLVLGMNVAYSVGRSHRHLSWLGRLFFAAHPGPGRRFRLAGQIAELAVVAQGLSGNYAEFRPQFQFNRRVFGSFTLNW